MIIGKNNKVGVWIGLLFFIYIQLSFSQQDSSIQTKLNKDSLVSNDTIKESNQKKTVFLSAPSIDSTHKKTVVPGTNKPSVKIISGIQLGSILPSAKPDSIKPSGFINKFKSKIKADSSVTKAWLKKIIPKTTGTISAGYDYGVIPFAANIKYPMGYFSSQGNIGFSVLGIPLAATYYYSDLKYVSGLNNYFRVSFDANAYKDVRQNKNFEKLDEEKEALNSLNQIKQQLTQKLAFAQNMQNGLTNNSELNSQLSNYTNRLNADKYKNQSNSQEDSIKPKANIPRLTLSDSINQLTGLIKKNDSISQKVEHYIDALQKIEQQIKSVQKKIELLKDPQRQADQSPYMGKLNSFLSGVKKFEIGMCYPNYSTFLVNGSSLKGINVEWEKKFYVAFTYGKTINTILTTNNIIQNQLQTVRNGFNFFDFSNVKDSRKIAALKFGYGKKDGTHLYVGFLYGVGLPSYVSQIPQNSLEKNLVLELDGRIALNASNSLELIYGKSALFQSGIPGAGENIPSGFPINNFRSNAGLVRYSSFIKKTKTKLYVFKPICTFKHK